MTRPTLILVSPKGAANVGGVARLMGNFGLDTLRLVKPRCDLASVECKQMSMHGYSFIQKAKIFPTLAEAQQDMHFSIAFSARKTVADRPTFHVFECFQQLIQRCSEKDRMAFVFGREETGLRLHELSSCDWQVFIPTETENASLNLTSAVAVVLSIFFYQTRFCAKTKSASIERPQKIQEELFFQKLFSLLERIKFQNPQNPEHLRDDLKAMYQRAEIRDRDLRILFGILSHIEKVLGS